MHVRKLATIPLILLVSATTAFARPQSAAPASATRYIKADAPLAQKLVLEVKAAHPEIKKIGMHAVPPGATESAIIGSDNPSKIGKVSSANDLTVFTSGIAKVYLHPEEGGFFDLGLPLFDAERQPVGMMVIEIPYKDAATQEIALGLGEKIRDEIAAKIPNKQALFR